MLAETICRLLEEAQEDFPLEERPFLRLAQRIGVSESDVIDIFARLQRDGHMRELSAFFDPSSLGYVSTLACMSVPTERVEEVVALLGKMPQVTHNYLRDHEVNLWFTVIAPSQEAVRQCLADIQQRTGLGPVHDLPAEKVFKVRVVLEADVMLA